jgi:hypothetical protein
MIAFLHIPKTGGTSFSNALRDMVSSGTCQLLSDSDLKQNLAFNGECGLVMGHFTWHGIARYSVGAQIITMLRHPVARAISQYQSWHDSPMDPNWESHLKRNRDAAEALNFARSVRIEEYFASEWEPITRQFTNFQAYVLSGRHIPSTPFKIWDGDVLRDAKDNLARSVGFFGLTERMDESVMLLGATLLIGKPVPKVAFHNASRLKSDDWQIPEVVRRIESRSPMDLELYQWAQEEFARRLDAISPPALL